ncbi:MAG: hypothetical protein IJK25_00080, partial [Firmicutes bacterium]|nr:hypothetical protein [Bacillota bacterium]
RAPLGIRFSSLLTAFSSERISLNSISADVIIFIVSSDRLVIYNHILPIIPRYFNHYFPVSAFLLQKKEITLPHPANSLTLLLYSAGGVNKEADQIFQRQKRSTSPAFLLTHSLIQPERVNSRTEQII